MVRPKTSSGVSKESVFCCRLSLRSQHGVLLQQSRPTPDKPLRVGIQHALTLYRHTEPGGYLEGMQARHIGVPI